MREFAGKTAVVTGACRGIGRALAGELAARDVRLCLVSDDEQALLIAQRELSAQTECHIRVADLSDPDARDRLIEQIGRSPIDLLVHNAGRLAYGRLDALPWEVARRTVALNLEAPLHLTHGLLPHLLERPVAHVVFMGSICSYVTLPRTVVYQTAKFGLCGLARSLRVDYPRLGTTLVCPGFVRTEIYNDAYRPSGQTVPLPPRWLTTTPQHVARRTIHGVQRNRFLVPVTPLAHALYWAPDWCLKWVHRCMPWQRFENASQGGPDDE